MASRRETQEQKYDTTKSALQQIAAAKNPSSISIKARLQNFQ
jgi:hypothetical protein